MCLRSSGHASIMYRSIVQQRRRAHLTHPRARKSCEWLLGRVWSTKGCRMFNAAMAGLAPRGERLAYWLVGK